MSKKISRPSLKRTYDNAPVFPWEDADTEHPYPCSFKMCRYECQILSYLANTTYGLNKNGFIVDAIREKAEKMLKQRGFSISRAKNGRIQIDTIPPKEHQFLGQQCYEDN